MKVGKTHRTFLGPLRLGRTIAPPRNADGSFHIQWKSDNSTSRLAASGSVWWGFPKPGLGPPRPVSVIVSGFRLSYPLVPYERNSWLLVSAFLTNIAGWAGESQPFPDVAMQWGLCLPYVRGVWNGHWPPESPVAIHQMGHHCRCSRGHGDSFREIRHWSTFTWSGFNDKVDHHSQPQ